MQSPRDNINWEVLLNQLENSPEDFPWEKLTEVEQQMLLEMKTLKEQPLLWQAAQQLDTDKAYEQVMHRIGDAPLRVKHSKTTWWKWSAAAAVLMLIAAGTWMYKHNTPNQRGVQIVEQTNPQPNATVKLILNDEQEVAMDTLVALQEQNGSAISNGDKELKYEQGQEIDQPLIYNTIVVPAGKQYRLVLSDGSKVWMNAASSLRYPVKFSAQERHVQLTGEAYFEVANKAAQPFLVTVNEQEIKVLGTSFNIRAYNHEQTVTLLTGKIQWRQLTGTTAPLILLPNDQVAFNGTTAQRKKVAGDDYILWMKHQVLLDGRNMEDVMAELERHYALTFHFSNNELKQLRFAGSLELQQDINSVLDVIAATNKVKFMNEKGIITIYKK